jgi:hypothetical protein
MGIEDVEKRLRNLGILVIDLVMNPRGEEGEPLDQTLNMGIFGPIRFEQQSGRNLWILGGELSPHLTEKTELSLIIGE